MADFEDFFAAPKDGEDAVPTGDAVPAVPSVEDDPEDGEEVIKQLVTPAPLKTRDNKRSGRGGWGRL